MSEGPAFEEQHTPPLSLLLQIRSDDGSCLVGGLPWEACPCSLLDNGSGYKVLSAGTFHSEKKNFFRLCVFDKGVHTNQFSVLIDSCVLEKPDNFFFFNI